MGDRQFIGNVVSRTLYEGHKVAPITLSVYKPLLSNDLIGCLGDGKLYADQTSNYKSVGMKYNDAQLSLKGH